MPRVALSAPATSAPVPALAGPAVPLCAATRTATNPGKVAWLVVFGPDFPLLQRTVTSGRK
jgi:hypothetical protein